MGLSVVILAAGEGSRMRSETPKVLHLLGGNPLLEHVVLAARELESNNIYVVYGHGGERVRAELDYLEVDWVEQAEQLGTGHAVMQVMPHIAKSEIVLILYGDVPLIKPATLKQLIEKADENNMGLLTAKLDDPGGYGRIVRDADGNVVRIVEHKDASGNELSINEINTGIMAISSGHLQTWLAALGNNNAQGEYYLTDVIEMAVNDGVTVNSVLANSKDEISGINDRAQLAELERHYQREQAEKLMLAGTTLRDPARFDLRGELTVGKDVTIDINAVFEGKVTLGDRVTIGPNAIIKDTHIGDDAIIKANSILEDAEIGSRCIIGPFARIRPETKLADEVHIGNFVEIKKSQVETGTKINHLTYVGDSEVGKHVNIGAGVITCNYDGANKHKTVIGDDVFVGSDSQLVAPVKIGAGATIGAGSTITKDVPPEELALSRTKQFLRSDWRRPQKKK